MSNLFSKPHVPKPPTIDADAIEEERRRQLAAQKAGGRNSTILSGAGGINAPILGSAAGLSGGVG